MKYRVYWRLSSVSVFSGARLRRQTGDIVFQISRLSQSKAIQFGDPFRLQPPVWW